MSKYVKAIKDFSGGLSEVANDNIPDNRLVTAKNAIPGDGYGIAKAGGTSIAFDRIDSDYPVTMLAEIEERKKPHVIACTKSRANKWFMWDWDGAKWRQVGTNIRPMKDWFVYSHKLFWLDGKSFWYYDGSVIEEVSNDFKLSDPFWAKVKTAIAVTQWAGRWFFATADNELLVSEVGHYNEFKEVNIINVTSGLADTITALHSFNDGVLIFQKRAVYYWTGVDVTNGTDIKLSRLSVECGTRWPKSICTISNAVLYLGDNGLYRLSLPYYSSAIAATNISEKQASGRLTEAATDVTAIVHNGVYYIALETEEGVKEYRYFLNSGAWWGEFTQEPYSYGSRLMGTDRLYIGCKNGYVLYYDDESYHYINTETGRPAPIQVDVKTKGYDVVGSTVIDSKVKRAFLVLRQYHAEKSHMETQIKTDYQEKAWAVEVDGMIWGNSIWGSAYWGWIDPVTKMVQINRKCKRCQFIFRGESGEEPLSVYGIALLYKKKKAKGSRLNVFEVPIKYDDDDEDDDDNEIVASPSTDYMGSYKVIPSQESQVLATNGKQMLHDVTIAPIPSNYGLITHNGTSLRIT